MSNIRPRRKPRPGRLKGQDMQDLREQRYALDQGRCQKCFRMTYMNAPQERDYSFHLAHIRNKRMWGDSIDNVETECGGCHRTYHNYGPSMAKPVPPKR